MKICAACNEDLPKDSYSKKQWKLDEYQRRCKVCVTNNREVQPPPQQDNNDINTNEVIGLDTMYLEDGEKMKRISDEELFKQSQYEDCPICFLRLPKLQSGSRYQTCCGKVICSGCAHASVYDDQGNEVDNEKCAFCRTLDPTSEEIMKRIKKRVKLNDAYAIHSLGCHYRDGKNGFPQHYKKAFELYHRAGELGHATAYCSIGYAYNNGQGVEVDKKKAVHYTELAAIGGCAQARYNLAIWEEHEVARNSLGNDELHEDKGGERERDNSSYHKGR